MYKRQGSGDQAARAGDRPVPGGAVDGGQEDLGGCPADALQVHVDAGQGRATGVHHDVPVVEADQGDLAGHVAAGLAQAFGDAAGDLVVAAEDGVEVDAAGEEDAGGLAAPRLGPFAVEHRRGEFHLGGGGRGTDLGRVVVLRPGDVGDPAAAGVEQVADGAAGAVGFVGDDGAVGGVGGADERVDHRHG